MFKKFGLLAAAGAVLALLVPMAGVARAQGRGGGGRGDSGGRGNSSGRSYSGGRGYSGQSRGFSGGGGNGGGGNRGYSGGGNYRGYSGGGNYRGYSGGEGYRGYSRGRDYDRRDYDRGRYRSYGGYYYGGRGLSFGFYSAPYYGYGYGPGAYYGSCGGYYDQWGYWQPYPCNDYPYGYYGY